MDQLKKLYIKSEEKELYLDTDNYLLDQEDVPVQKLKEKYFNLPLSRIQEIQSLMTKAHCEHEMNFQIKDDSGLYSKVIATPFHGLAPISKKYVDELTLSTKEVLSATRKLLQALFSNKEISADSLNINHLPKNISDELISIIKENIYYEPMLSHESLKDYPFLALVGFDCAVENLKESENAFFEFNAGTPCGIEDQYQLFNHFKNIAPELSKLISPYLEEDESHKILKETIDNCAKSWTNNKEGISVILSPGPYNPAHPEIASLAVRSQMPLVKIQDLYIDNNGDVRLKTTCHEHPIVTGIYNRKEESFLTYSQKYKIPLRSPFTKQNAELSKKYNTHLKEGILYSYTYDQNFNITGVDIDKESNEPIYQILFEQISPDPKTGEKGDIIKALWEKKVYISNIGGRVFDDKRAFRIIHEYLTSNTDKVAHPPKNIPVSELNENIDQAVIKAPDLSGGAGVVIGAQLSKKEKEEKIKEVNKNTSYYEIQKMVKLAVINSYSEEYKKIISLPIDWRLIVAFGPEERPRVSTHSCLVRTANYGGLKTNTSAGGGYALGLIYNDQKVLERKGELEPKKALLTETRKNDIKSFLGAMNELIEKQDITLCEPLTYMLRDIMDLIGLENITWINNLRRYQKNEISIEELKISYQNFLKKTGLSDIKCKKEENYS